MKVTNALILSTIITIIAIVIANIIGTEYRIKRERKEVEKNRQDGLLCPPCPACENAEVKV